ncbi:hypothetical protein chiPu_0003420 [Chiloscyllium punctatum]|uniref:Uncharacterized protein n=1 Tax=Chiloscyllium punctatum TaxID=137246 RepID=A0A401S3R4_CHIPU|nr:hypothetical protein [Chiloscyllium punctatum]
MGRSQRRAGLRGGGEPEARTKGAEPEARRIARGWGARGAHQGGGAGTAPDRYGKGSARPRSKGGGAWSIIMTTRTENDSKVSLDGGYEEKVGLTPPNRYHFHQPSRNAQNVVVVGEGRMFPLTEKPNVHPMRWLAKEVIVA